MFHHKETYAIFIGYRTYKMSMSLILKYKWQIHEEQGVLDFTTIHSSTNPME
jgi:hypothetical protein